MGDRMPYRPAPLKKVTLQSACVRLHDLHGDSPATWENRMSGEASDYRQVARINTVLRALGLADKVGELMAPIEVSLAARPCADAELREGVTDGAEDILQTRYKLNPCPATARLLLDKRATERAASLDDDLRIAALHGLTL